MLPLYSILLALLALLGYCALAAGIHIAQPNLAIPLLFKTFFPDWFLGVAYAAIVIGALVPAAIMAIGSANLFASNVFQEFRRDRPPFEARNAKLLCLAVCAAGLAIATLVKMQLAINLQLLGGALMVQAFPATALALYTRWFHPRALLAGWACGIIASTLMWRDAQFKTAVFALPLGGGHVLSGYIGLYAVLINVLVSVALTPVLRRTKLAQGFDSTTLADYA